MGSTEVIRFLPVSPHIGTMGHAGLSDLLFSFAASPDGCSIAQQLEEIFSRTVAEYTVLIMLKPVSVGSANRRRIVRGLAKAVAKGSINRERLRKRYRPDRVRILFVGESPPASGRFFYQADSGLYRAVKDTFVAAFPLLRKADFLDSFRSLGCYLVDLCGEPVDRMTRHARRCACRAGEVRLARTIRELRPKVIVTIVRSIRANVRQAQEQAGWSGLHLELPYPGRWRRHRIEFHRQLLPLLKNVARNRGLTSVLRSNAVKGG